MSDKVLIRVRGLKKYYNGDKIKALDGVSTDIAHGEVVVVIGPSGSGKSTFLRSLNLLELPTAGSIELDGAEITDPKTDINLHRQKMGMVFQHFNLFPHMTVLRNMTLAPMKLLGKSREEAEARANELLVRVGLGDRGNAYPSQLSGGQ
ncbi:MAG: amino acid ABC transporter ATP-binding protein, partial [Clostridia bacterium]|nr:amino acid ABC transporter ATP-binding protein [Clostridia bacterium]